MNWLKAWVRKWCAPDYAEREKAYHSAMRANDDLVRRHLARNKEKAAALPLALDAMATEQERDSAPPWEQADAIAWRTFLGTATGIRVRRQLAFWERVGNRSAVLQRQDFDNNCGYARGFYRCAEWLLSTLSADVRPQQDDDMTPSTGAARGHEANAPLTHGS